MNYVVGDLAQPVHGEKITVKDIVQWHCQRCDEALTDPENTGRLLRGALSLYRAKHRLLQPADLRALRTRLRLTPAALAQLLHERTRVVSAWEQDKGVQTPLQDAVLRMLREVPGSLDFLRKRAA